MRKGTDMVFADFVKNTVSSGLMFRFFSPETNEEQIKTAAGTGTSCHDMSQTARRADKLLAEMEEAGRSMEKIAEVIAQKTDLLCSGSGNAVQLEKEIDSAARKLQELKRQKEDMKMAAAICRQYGIYGLDYSVTAGRLYYKGKAVRCFLDDEYAEEDGNRHRFIYQNPDGEVSAAAKHGRTGFVVYLKVYGHSDERNIKEDI